MKKILESEYIKAKSIVDQYDKQIKCECKNTIYRVFYDTHPYGQNISYDECIDCGEWKNFTTF